MSQISKLQKIIPRALASYDAATRRALEQAESEWERQAPENWDFTEQHRNWVKTRAGALVEQFRPQEEKQPAPSARPVGKTVARYTDGSVLIELEPDDPQAVFKPYGNGTAVQGPELARHLKIDPNGRPLYGDATKHPGYREEQERQERATQRRHAGIPAHLPNAPMTNANGVSNLRLSPTAAADGSYGNPETFLSRDSWRGRFTGGANLAGAGEKYGKSKN